MNAAAEKRSNPEPEVLIVGARTTGLMLAIQLRRQGISVRIVDHSPCIDPHSRASLLHSRSLELLQGLGLAEEIAAHGQVLRGFRLFADRREVLHTRDPPVDSPFPYAIAYAQPKIEAILERRLRELGVAVERNTTLIAMEREADQVRVVLRSSNGRDQATAAAWVVGCDGAHSATRKLQDLALMGDDSPYAYIVADVRMENDHPPDTSFSCLHEDGHLLVTVLDEGRRLMAGSLPLGHSGQGEPSLPEMQAIVDRRLGGGHSLSDPRWLDYFRVHYRVAERYRVGRVFLAGDAAHLNSPFGGHGMNTGLQDAANLAWKLALVIEGVASDRLLDSYETERRPAGEAMVAASKRTTEPGETYPRLSEDERRGLLAAFPTTTQERLAFRRGFEELDLDYGAGALCRDGDPSLPDELRPGRQARDAPGLRREGKACGLFDLLAGPKHVLLIFPPAEPEEATTPLRPLLEKNGFWMSPLLVGSQAPLRANITFPPCLIDAAGALRQRYGMSAGGLYLLRPDGYIAYRSRDFGSLACYVDSLLAEGSLN
ncbi:MAG: FAD-dependent monooxygenase [Verrucomicrobiota bacterium]